MVLKRIGVAEARRLIDAGGVLVDVREADEHAREHIPGARHRALSSLELDGPVSADAAIIYHCRSGGRTTMNADRLAAASGGDCALYELEGGIEAWKAAGLPVDRPSGGAPSAGKRRARFGVLLIIAGIAIVAVALRLAPSA